jgi:hypothetical protein
MLAGNWLLGEGLVKSKPTAMQEKTAKQEQQKRCAKDV